MKGREIIESWIKTISETESALGVKDPNSHKQDVIIELLLDIRELLQKDN